MQHSTGKQSSNIGRAAEFTSAALQCDGGMRQLAIRPPGLLAASPEPNPQLKNKQVKNMADEQPQPGADQQGQAPIAINILAQYVKDLSFENPRAPASLQSNQGQPAIDISVNVAVNDHEQDNVYEVVLNLRGKGATKEGEDVSFIVELSYGGLFSLQNVPQEHLNLFLVVEAPRLIFPFARRVFADAVRDGGFPPLMLDPIDFAQLYMAQQQRMAQQGEGGPGGNGSGNGGGDTPNIILPS